MLGTLLNSLKKKWRANNCSWPIPLILFIITSNYSALHALTQTKILAVKKPSRLQNKGNTVYPFTLGDLPYAYNAMEPYIDARTMEIHHSKHHQTYVDNLNAALKPYPELHQKSLLELLKSLSSLPQDIQTAVRNNGGGHWNHAFFWNCLSPKYDQQPTKDVSELINTNFGSFESFKEQFNNAAKKVFGSGWAWLCADNAKKLVIISSPNQDSPISQGLTPLLCLDIWEHAYYLKYQNKRVDYIDAFWHLVNWAHVQELYEQIK